MESLLRLREQIPPHVTLVAVSKTRPIEDLVEAYAAGQRDFGENRVQELLEKAPGLPADARMHHIGHLQTNKVKALLPAVYLIHGVDSERLLAEVGRRAMERGHAAEVLLQVHIAQEEQKFGWDGEELERELEAGLTGRYAGVRVRGLMGMATFTDDKVQIRREFRGLNGVFERHRAAHGWDVLSMGMSGDWEIAVEEGSTLVRIGSAIFGGR
jgi:pyridoxal phosphate enzyme (YggS family)